MWVAAPCDGADSSSREGVCVFETHELTDGAGSISDVFFLLLQISEHTDVYSQSVATHHPIVWADNGGNPLKTQYTEHITAAINQ